MLPAEIIVNGERLLLHPHRALFWHAPGWLVVSDMHLGKAAHLRKGGLPLPEGNDERTLQRMDTLITALHPRRIVVLGDLFHSSVNAAWERVEQWAAGVPVPIHLVPGNHDILAQRRYAEAGIHLCDESVEEGPFVFTHAGAEARSGYTLSGHVHPGVMLHGQARQHMRLPAFHFGARHAVLPAFGMGTGLHLVAPRPGDRLFACTERAVIDVSGLMAGRTPTR